MTDSLASDPGVARFRALGLGVFVLLASSCHSSDRLAPPQVPITETTDSTTPTPPDTGNIPVDSTGVPVDSSGGVPPDSTGGVPPDTTSGVPPDSTGGAPADSIGVLTPDSLSTGGSRDTCAVKAATSLTSTASGKDAPGIAFGAFDMPAGMMGSNFTGAARASGSYDILCTLATARRVGARVILRFSGGDTYFRNPDRTINLAQWMARIDRYKRVNLQPFIDDGTLLAHYILDEPHNAQTWKNQVPYETVEAMAKYSKQLWPDLATVVRAYPDWLGKASFRWQYLDAAWAQYSLRKGEVHAWMKEQAAAARSEGLGLIVGLNILNGGDKTSGVPGPRPGAYMMSAKQIKEWGAVLAADPISCGLYNWKYIPNYFSRSDVKAALEDLSAKSKNRQRQSCKG